MSYKVLFSPITLANQEIKNRIALAPAGTGLESQYVGGRISTEFIDYFEERARGGAGLIISCFAAIDKRYYCLTLGVYSRDQLSGISRAAEAVQVFGSRFILQISHFGGKAPRNFVLNDPVAPSSIESRMYPEKPKEMTLEQIEEAIALFIQSAEWARDAGCDGVELHGGHGYLLGQFVSPHSNRRQDDYGGTLEKRMNIITKISKEIRKKCGDDFIIGYKFSAHEHLKGGIDIGLAQKIAQYLDKQGIIDYLHVSSFSTTLPGFLDCDYPSVPPIYTPEPLVPLAEKIKQKVNRIVIMATGGITDPDHRESIIYEKKADMVALGRALIADPEWPNKAKNGGNIKYCIKCNICYKRVLNQQSIKCSVNPYIGEERRYWIYRTCKTEQTKKVVVVGAGPAGMEAALTADKRGHDVILLEKNRDIGGYLKLAGAADFKFEVRKLLDYYGKEIAESGVELRTGVEATPEYVVKENPDAVVLALGSIPNVLKIPGASNKNVFLSTELFEKRQFSRVGTQTIIIGAGLIGLELALYLSLKVKNIKIRVVDIINEEEILEDEHMTNKSMLLRKLKKANLDILTGHEVVEITDDGVIARSGSKEKKTLNCDSVIISAGFKPRSELCKEYKEKLESFDSRLEIYSAGDCVKCEKLYNAINSGAHVAWQL